MRESYEIHHITATFKIDLSIKNYPLQARMLQIYSLLLLLIAAIVGADEAFVSPGPSVSKNNPTTGNAIHPVGSRFHIAWDGTNLTKSISVVLFQYHGTELVYPFEYIVRKCSLYILA